MVQQHAVMTNEVESEKSFAAAAALAEPKLKEWPVYVLERAENALVFAQRHADPERNRPAEVQRLVTHAATVAKQLIDRKDDARIQPRHRAAAYAAVIHGHLLALRPADAQAELDRALADAVIAQEQEALRALCVALAENLAALPGMTKGTRVVSEGESRFAAYLAEKAVPIVQKATPYDQTRFYQSAYVMMAYWSKPLIEAERAKDTASKLRILRQMVPHIEAYVTMQKDASLDAFLKHPDRPTTLRTIAGQFDYWSRKLVEYRDFIRQNGVKS